MPDYLEKFEKMRVAGKLAAETLDMLTDNIKPGVTTEFIDKLGYEFIRDNGAYSAPLFYRGFKKSNLVSLLKKTSGLILSFFDTSLTKLLESP